jgi:Domain of unknown function (DUF5122) beta-propeller
VVFRDSARAMVVQPDGKIVEVGDRGPGGPSASLVARLNPDGSPDPSFGSSPGGALVPGIVLTDVVEGDHDGFVDVRVVGDHILRDGTAGGGRAITVPSGAIAPNGGADARFSVVYLACNGVHLWGELSSPTRCDSQTNRTHTHRDSHPQR